MVPMFNLKRSALFAVPTIAVLVLSGCGGTKYYSDRNYEYYHAKLEKPLQLPASRYQSEFIDAMPVPQAASSFVAPKGHFVTPQPPGMNQQFKPRVSISQANNQRWLVVNDTPSDVWPNLVDYASQHGGGVKATLPQQGTIETNNFVIAVRQGSDTSATDVFCLKNNTTKESCIRGLNSYLSEQSGSNATDVDSAD